MTLTDTDPLVAILNRNDPRHAQCVGVLKQLTTSLLVTTWPCFTEAMYLLERVGGYAGQVALWRLRFSGRISFYDLNEADTLRMQDLMAKYRDLPMDLADASLVAAAESLRVNQIFTIDNDFYIYRLYNNTPIDVIP